MGIQLHVGHRNDTGSWPVAAFIDMQQAMRQGPLEFVRTWADLDDLVRRYRTASKDVSGPGLREMGDVLGTYPDWRHSTQK